MQGTFEAGGHGIRMDVYAATTGANTRKPGIMLLHGAGGNIGWLDRLPPHLTSAGVSVSSAHYLERTGTSRAELATITDGVHVPRWLDTVSAAMLHIQERSDMDASRVALVGISLGAFLTMSFAAVTFARASSALL